MNRSKLLPAILLLSLFINASLAWGLYSKQSAKGNPQVSYSSSIQMIKWAESSLTKGMNETGTKRSKSLYLAFSHLAQSRLFSKDYEDVFLSSGVSNVSTLTTMLQNDYFFLGDETDRAIDGKPINEETVKTLQDIQKDLQRIIQTLPESYKNIKELKEPFEKLSRRE